MNTPRTTFRLSEKEKAFLASLGLGSMTLGLRSLMINAGIDNFKYVKQTKKGKKKS